MNEVLNCLETRRSVRKYLPKQIADAELNAILNYSGGNVHGSTVYTTLFPCNECAKALIQAGVKRVVYLSDKYSDSDSVKASKMMFRMTGVEFVQYEPTGHELTLEL